MLNLLKNGFLTHEFDIFFHFWYLNVENDTKCNQVVYCFIYSLKDTQYFLSITKKLVGFNDTQNKKNLKFVRKGF